MPKKKPKHKHKYTTEGVCDNCGRKKPTKPEGRPTDYRPEYCKQIIEFFSKEAYRDVQIERENKKGDVFTTTEERANDLPLFCKFAFDIGVNADTLNEWCKVHKEFSDSYARAKHIQEHILITNGLKNLYNSGFAQFVAINNMGYKSAKNENEDKVNVKHTIDDVRSLLGDSIVEVKKDK